ncbi:MAG: hypothetical protein RL596_1973 [Bacteroidota bacterium]|jgi:imidazolonepropionase-like amidohydrolase
MKRKTGFFFQLLLACGLMPFLGLSQNQKAAPPPAKNILITNVQIFDGKNEQLTNGNILISNNLITKVSSNPIVVDNSDNTTIIDGKGKLAMPGLIDAHAHVTTEIVPLQIALTADASYIQILATKAAEAEIMRGFTTIRDVSGPTFGLKRAIDEGIVAGPRIYPSGSGIGQTSGHSDFRATTDIPVSPTSPPTYMERNGFSMVADGADQVLLRTRELLKQGASQIKLMAGGGVVSNFDPLDVTQYTEPEIKAAVDAATNWGTYVTVHAYTPNAIQSAIRAGVKCIEHGQLADEATAKIMAEKGIWWSLQPFLDDEDAIPIPEGTPNRKKQLEMVAGTDNAYKLAKKYNIKTAFGTDCLFDRKLSTRQGAQLAKLVRWYTPFEVLKMATSTNATLLAMSGKRNPYPNGKLGVIEEGAYADIILVDGNPIQNIKLIEDPEKNFLLIMKNGKIYKNQIQK